jgi:ribulose-phosphate 3-epimerase
MADKIRKNSKRRENMIKVSPSLLAADFGDLRRQVEIIEKGGADFLHLDVMDGHFVPNITFGADVIYALRPYSKLVFDVHLMIENPEKYIDVFADAGADIITVHVEAAKHIYRVLEQIKAKGIKAGIALNPGTPPESIGEVMHLVDLVLVMTVNPGFTAQRFIPSVVPKISKIRTMAPVSTDIEVDGGINLENADVVKEAGANIIVAGAAVFRAEDPAFVIEGLKR